MTDTARLHYVALGGAGEVGMNMYAYGYGTDEDRRYILVDVGVTFPDMESTPGVDLIMADPGFIADQADRLEAIFITHAHEDHVGALPHLWPRLKAPVYARRFTAEIARMKLDQAGLDPEIVNLAPPWPEQIAAGPFRVGFLPIAHSIPEASSLVIDSPAGRLLHTGDYKADTTPLVGEPYAPELIQQVAAGGIQALVCDSTNVFAPHPGRSEADLAGPITELVRKASGMVVATTFASNIARVRTLAQAGEAAGRAIVVMGRAMLRMLDAARRADVLPDFPTLAGIEDLERIPGDHLMVIVTGSQGERRAMSAQLARGAHGRLEIGEGDTFLFSSKTIPGNEVAVAAVENQLTARGVRVFDGEDGRYHVSGHANRPDLEALHKLVAPRMLVPMHGEFRHLAEHAALAEAGGIAAGLAPNGTILDLSGERPVIAGQAPVGRLYLDGSVLVGARDGIVRERLKLALRGQVILSLLLDEDGNLLDEAWAEIQGLRNELDDGQTLGAEIEAAVTRDLENVRPKERQSDDAVERIAKKSTGDVCLQLIGRKPAVLTMINRIT
ncbi:MAG: ribonuclease J [Pseudomonadota bacterium]